MNVTEVTGLLRANIRIFFQFINDLDPYLRWYNEKRVDAAEKALGDLK